MGRVTWGGKGDKIVVGGARSEKRTKSDIGRKNGRKTNRNKSTQS